jgi:5-methylthioadenosine/S-adenosylhomocysteine deaminase
VLANPSSSILCSSLVFLGYTANSVPLVTGSTVAGHSSTADVLVSGGDVVTMNAGREVLVGGTVAITGDRILDVGSTSALRATHPHADVLDATGCVVTPGLIDAHQHLTGDPLVRSCIPDLLRPGQSIFEWSVPLHGAHTAEDDEVAATVTAVECVRNGTTTVVEAGTVAHPDRVVKALEAVGLRGTIGTWGWDVDGVPFSASPDEVLDRQREVLRRWPAGSLVEGWVTLVGHNLASDELLAGAAALAREVGVGLTMHISPTSSDPEAYLERTGRRPLAHFDALGVLGRHLLLAHAVWLDDDEVELVLEREVGIAYTPWAYLRLGQGVTRVGRHAEIVERGGRVALGCDSSNAADHHDVLKQAALAAGIARDSRVDPTRFGAHQAFELATIRGAEAIGMGDRIGSLEPGKLADVVVHDARTLDWTPRGDPALQLVWGADGRTVRDVIVGGRFVVRDGRCTTVDVEALRADATAAQRSLLQRTGIEVPHPWPHIDAR